MKTMMTMTSALLDFSSYHHVVGFLMTMTSALLDFSSYHHIVGFLMTMTSALLDFSSYHQVLGLYPTLSAAQTTHDASRTKCSAVTKNMHITQSSTVMAKIHQGHVTSIDLVQI